MNVKRMYNEILVTSLIMNFFDALLTFGAVFAIGFFITYFYGLSILFAFAVALVFFIRSLYLKIKQNKILLLETRYPDLKERLRTSYDYQERTNTVINDLHSDILSIMKKVDVNAFLNGKELFLKVFLICFLMTGTLYLSAIGFDIFSIRDSIVRSGAYKKANDFASGIFGQNIQETKNRPLLDKPRLITIGDKELNLSIDAYDTELDMNDISNPDKNDYGGNYPGEIAGEAQQVYEENIPEEYKEAIKEYFKKINK
jgi:hypothetical protein